MSFLGGILGTNSNFQAGHAPIVDATSQNQANQGYNEAQSQLNQQNQLVNALQAQNGIQNQSNVFNQLQGVANGTGPNPAQAQLNQSTAQNVANQGALMASQRGSSANPALIARQAAMQGANIQQNAAGQAATLGAQQQLGALNQLGGIAGQQVGQLQQGIGTGNQLAQNEQGIVLNALGQQNNAHVADQGNVNNNNQSTAAQNAQGQSSLLGGLAGGIGSALTGGLGSKILGGIGSIFGGGGSTTTQGSNGTPGANLMGGLQYAQGGKVPSEGPKSKAGQHLFNSKSAVTMKSGGTVPGQAQVKGNSPKNDTQPALLSPGEIVIPRSVTQGKDPINDSAKFVAAVMSKSGPKSKK